MKRSELYFGVGYFLAGVLLLILGLATETALDGIIFGLAGACLGPGAVMIFKYFYWTRPGKREEYARLAEREKIEMEDELKASLRDKSGRYTYLLGLVTLSISILVFSALDTLGILDGRLLVLYLSGFLVFQFGAGLVIFRCLLKKFQ